MGQVLQTDFINRFPVINFRKKRLSVVIHAQFDMECESDVTSVRQMIEKAMSEINKEGAAKITYSLSDI
jgi:hypothetical protein